MPNIYLIKVDRFRLDLFREIFVKKKRKLLHRALYKDISDQLFIIVI